MATHFVLPPVLSTGFRLWDNRIPGDAVDLCGEVLESHNNVLLELECVVAGPA